MFLKSNLRPATVGAGEQNIAHSSRNSSMVFDAGSDDVFGDLSGYSDRANPTPSAQPKRNSAPVRRKNSRFNLDIKSPKVFIPIIAAIVAIIAIIIILAVAGSGDIKYTNNSYLLYKDSNDAYHVVSNGEVIEHVFEGEVKLVEAADRSFAYVYDYIDGDSAVKMYILKGKKLTPLLGGEPVGNIICQSTLEPGIVYLDAAGINYMIYNEKDGEEQLAKKSDAPKDFQISGDGKTVAYTIKGRNDASDRILCLYEGRNSEEIVSASSVPVAISNYGKYLYITRPVGNGSSEVSLYVCDTKSKKYDIYQIEGSEGFEEILEMNVNGDEVIFSALKPAATNGSGDAVEQVNGGVDRKSYLYRHKASKDKSLIEIGNGYVTLADFDPEVAIHKNFKDVYLVSRSEKTDTANTKYATFYLNKKYEKSIISSKYTGKFSPDCNYFYYVNKDGDLIRMDLKSKQIASDIIDNDVVDFVITKKGNIYSLRSNNNLNYYKTSSENRERVFYDVDMISFYNNSNRLYFINNAEGPAIDVSKESTDYDPAKFGSTELTALPYFTTPDIKKCYAIVWNAEKEAYSVYYTSSGKRFKFLKKVEDCVAVIINGEEINLQDYIIDVE